MLTTCTFPVCQSFGYRWVVLLDSSIYTQTCSSKVFELHLGRSFKLKHCSGDSYAFPDMLKFREEAIRQAFMSSEITPKKQEI